MTGDADVLLGDLDGPGSTGRSRSGCRGRQYEYWKHTHLTVDVVPGRGSGFSVEAPDGVRFLIRSRLLTNEELEHFQLASAPMQTRKSVRSGHVRFIFFAR